MWSQCSPHSIQATSPLSRSRQSLKLWADFIWALVCGQDKNSLWGRGNEWPDGWKSLSIQPSLFQLRIQGASLLYWSVIPFQFQTVRLALWLQPRPHSVTACLAVFRSEYLPASWLSLPVSADTPTYMCVHLFLSAHVSVCVVWTCLSDSLGSSQTVLCLLEGIGLSRVSPWRSSSP